MGEKEGAGHGSLRVPEGPGGSRSGRARCTHPQPPLPPGRARPSRGGAEPALAAPGHPRHVPLPGQWVAATWPRPAGAVAAPGAVPARCRQSGTAPHGAARRGIARHGTEPVRSDPIRSRPDRAGPNRTAPRGGGGARQNDVRGP